MELGATVCAARAPGVRGLSGGVVPLARAAGRRSDGSRGRRERVRFEDTDRYVRGRVVAALVAGEGCPTGSSPSGSNGRLPAWNATASSCARPAACGCRSLRTPCPRAPRPARALTCARVQRPPASPQRTDRASRLHAMPRLALGAIVAARGGAALRRRCARRASGSTRPRRGTSCAGRSARCCGGSRTARATRRCSTCWSGAGRACFGDGEAGLRSLPALAGLLTVPVAYAIARRAAAGRRGARRARGGRARRRQPAARVVLAGGAQLRARDAAERGRAAAVPARARGRRGRCWPAGRRRRARARDALLHRVRAGAAGAVAAVAPPAPRAARARRWRGRRRRGRATAAAARAGGQPVRHRRHVDRAAARAGPQAVPARLPRTAGAAVRAARRRARRSAGRGCCCAARRGPRASARCCSPRSAGRGRAAAAGGARRRRLPQHAQPAAGAGSAAGGARRRLPGAAPRRAPARRCSARCARCRSRSSSRSPPMRSTSGQDWKGLARRARHAPTARVRSSSRPRTASWRCATTGP